MTQRRGEPALGTGPVGESRCAVTQVARTPATSVGGTSCELVPDGAAPVGEFDRVQATTYAVLRAEHSDAGVFGAGVDPEFHTVYLRLIHSAVFQPDHERSVPGNDGPPLMEELAGPGGAGGLQRCAVLVQDEHDGMARTGLLPNLAVGGDAIDAR